MPGPTFLAYTPNGRHLVTAGSNNVIRVYETGSNGEPVNVDDCQENNLAIAATVSADISTRRQERDTFNEYCRMSFS